MWLWPNGKFGNLRTVTTRVHVGNSAICESKWSELSDQLSNVRIKRSRASLRRTLLSLPPSQTVNTWKSKTVTRIMTRNTAVSWKNLIIAPAVHDMLASILIVPEQMSAAPHIKLHTIISKPFAR